MLQGITHFYLKLPGRSEDPFATQTAFLNQIDTLAVFDSFIENVINLMYCLAYARLNTTMEALKANTALTMPVVFRQFEKLC